MDTVEQLPPPQAAAPRTPEGVSALSWFTPTILLALIPFVGYLGAYAFQVKYFAYFGIPYYFVSLNSTLVSYTSLLWVLTGIVTSFLIFIVFIMYVVIHLSTPTEEVNNTRHSIYRISSFVLFSIFSISVIIGMYIYTMPPEAKKISFLVFIGFIILPPSIALYLYKVPKYRVSQKVLKIFLLSFFFPIVLFLLLRLYIWFGEKQAEIQDEFSIFTLPSSNTELAVIHNNGDYLLAVPFHRIARKNDKDKTPALFEKKLFILKISEISEISKTPLSFLSFEKVGPLKPKPEPEPKPKPIETNQ